MPTEQIHFPNTLLSIQHYAIVYELKALGMPPPGPSQQTLAQQTDTRTADTLI